MSSTREKSSEETFLCSICLEVFSEPVSTPCGHNFCRRCISQVWDTDGPCTCPLCKRRYDTRPELSVNTLLLEMVSQFKLEAEKSKSRVSKPGEVQCDVCSEPKLKALKSCLVCLSSFCETHLQPHLTVSGLKKHQLMEPVENLEDRMCPTHQQPLVLFCATDEKSVCMMCSVLDHKNHEFLSLQEACERRRSSLLQTQVQNQRMVEPRRQKIQEIQRILKLSETETLREKTAGLKAFSALMQCVQRHKDLFLKKLEEKQSESDRRAKDLVKQLEKEISDLEQSSAEAKRLSRYHDPLHFLQCPAPKPPTGLKEWSSVTFKPETCEGSVNRALFELEDSLSQEFKQIRTPEWRTVEESAVEVTLDPDTADPHLSLAPDHKQVYNTTVKKSLPNSPRRFEFGACVLGKQSFSSGRFYYKVQVTGKRNWSVGVARESIERKKQIGLSVKNGMWCLCLKNDKYSGCTDPTWTRVNPRRPPQKVGVFVDYEKGLVSFYDADSAVLLFSFTNCCFSEKLFPYFCPYDPGFDNVPLVITAVKTGQMCTVS